MSAAEGSEFSIEGVSAAHRSVEAWSTSRLPFEPSRVRARPWLPEFRAQLREELKELTGVRGEMLLAGFASDEQALFDVENVLLYNVGLNAFGTCARKGVLFERLDWASVPRSLGGAHCYHRYSVAPIAENSRPDGSMVARWRDVPVDALARGPTASRAWLTMRTAQAELSPLPAGQAFQVRLTLDVPQAAKASAIGLLKPLLDGIISTLHDYSGTDIERMSLHLSSKLREEQSRIRSLLTGRGSAPLGPRRVIGAWGRTTQWNPADDLCSRASLVIRRGRDSGWRLSGEISA